ncbi:hypothetical protein SUNI508_04065 [Seiridium unicorne]|uniref:Fungal N-terminal domain-containing protein n=1 Tax=Seiridium unicorne TaxID=138068 RepID=A0ABR2VAL6_9PEZI
MAEAFGLIASAAGIMSLGLQVYEGVASYIEGVKDRKSDLSAISRQANILQDIVNALQLAAPQIDAILKINGSPLLSSLKTVEGELWALKLFLGSLQDVSSEPPNIASRLKEQKRKLTYPFHRPTLEQLQRRLESANHALQTSLQVVNLLTTPIIKTTISDIHANVNNSQSTLTDLKSSMGSMETSLASMALSLAPTQAAMISMDGKLDLLSSRGTTQNESLGINLQAVNNNVSDVSNDLHKATITIQTSTDTIQEAIRQQNQDILQLRDEMSRSVVLPAVIATTIETVLEKKTIELTNSLMSIAGVANGTGVAASVNYPRLLLGRLMSKPSSLQDAFDTEQSITARTRQQPGVPILRAHRTCICKQRRVTQHWAKKFGDFYAIKKATTQSRHRPGCEYGADDSSSIAYVGTVSYTGFRKILSTSLELSMSCTSGAGGFSVGPTLTFRAMVDEADSPVFRLINLMVNNFGDLIKGCNPGDRKDGEELEKRVLVIEQLVYHSVSAILKLYQRSRRSRYDVNQHGESPLHRWIKLLVRLTGFVWRSEAIYLTAITFDCIQRIAETSVRRLAEIQQTDLIFDYSGNSPVDGLLGEINGSNTFSLFSEAMKILYRCNDENFARTHEIIQRLHLDDPTPLSDMRRLCDGCPDLVDIFGFGALSKAVIMGATGRLRSLLDTDPSALGEKNNAFQTPFHLAAQCSTSEVLEVLLHAAQNNSIQFDIPDSQGTHALDLAAQNSGRLCRNFQRQELCTDCVCSTVFDLLQSNGWQLSPVDVASPHWLLEYASQAVRLRIISTIKHIREEFRAVARRYLSPYECQRLQLDSQQIIDGHLYDVVKGLSEAGFDLPQNYKDLLQDQIFATKKSVYHGMELAYTSKWKLASIAQLLFESGFEDVNHEDVYGKMPLGEILQHKETYPWHVNSEIIVWFIQHGADISGAFPLDRWTGHGLEEPHAPVPTLAHEILPLKRIEHLVAADLDIIADILQKVSPLQFLDGCCCGCVVAGCNTTTQFFRYLWDIFLEDRELPSRKYARKSSFWYMCPCEAYSLEEVIERLVSEARSRAEDDKNSRCVQGSLDVHHNGDIELQNTLSTQNRNPEANYLRDYTSKQEGRTVLQECVHCLSKFLRLIPVEAAVWNHVSHSALRLFTFQALEIRHTCSSLGVRHSIYRPCSEEEIKEIQEEDHDLLDLLDKLVQEFVDELQDTGDTFDVFLTRYWVRRVEEVLADLDATKMSYEQVLAAEEVGVVWEDDTISVSDDAESYTPSPTTSERFEALIQQIDDIVAEST